MSISPVDDVEVGVEMYVCTRCFRRCEGGVMWDDESMEFRSHCCNGLAAIACLWPRMHALEPLPAVTFPKPGGGRFV